MALVVILVSGGGTDEAKGQTISFQPATETGDHPFTEPSDVSGDTTVNYPPTAAGGSSGGGSPSSEPSSGHGTFGGTSSDYVCDREKLIRELLKRPDRMRGWAETLGVDPTPKAVAKYIRGLRPVTLTQDTQVTNHAFLNGRVIAYQAILSKGTAVLVDKYGRPVARCRCGNPLTEPVYYKDATCYHCPPHYTPPPPCKYRPYDPYDQQYGQDPNTGDYLEPAPTDVEYKKKNPYSTCYVFYPNPPTVSLYEEAPQTETTTTTQTYTQNYTQTYTQTYTQPTHTSTEPGCCGGDTTPTTPGDGY